LFRFKIWCHYKNAEKPKQKIYEENERFFTILTVESLLICPRNKSAKYMQASNPVFRYFIFKQYILIFLCWFYVFFLFVCFTLRMWGKGAQFNVISMIFDRTKLYFRWVLI